MDDDVVEPAKGANLSELGSGRILNHFAFSLFLIEGSKIFLLNEILKKESLDSQVDNMADTPKSPKGIIPLNILHFLEMTMDCTA